jgi:hypothetical protein
LEAGRQRIQVHTLALAAHALGQSYEELVPRLSPPSGDVGDLSELAPDTPADHVSLVARLLASSTDLGDDNAPT